MGKEISVDCIRDPLGTVDSLFNSATCSVNSTSQLARWDWGVKDYFEKFLLQQGNYAQVPEINSTPLSAIPANTLVRFRGMVQDMFENEFYVGCYKSGEGLRTTKYTDSVTPDFCRPGRDSVELWERRILYCVPVPGENQWVKEVLASSAETGECSVSRRSSSPGSQAEKRQRDEGGSNIDMDVDINNGSTDESSEAKRRREEASTSWREEKTGWDLNFPLGETSFRAMPLRPCILKVYDSAESQIMLNDVIEFIGILTFDPELSASSFVKSEAELDSFMESNVCSRLPQSQVPRIHCVTLRKLTPNNMVSVLPELQKKQAEILATPGSVKHLRDTVLKGLAGVLKGDLLAAEYLLLHLLSQIHKRLDTMVLGPVSLKIVIAPSPENSTLPSEIAQAVRALLPCSYMMPLSCEGLNKAPWAPRKDYEQNRLATGVLQLAAGTHLTVDLTSMTEGKLNATGVQNLCTLKKMMQFQTVDYDFKYHPVEMSTDVSVLVTSNGARSFLPSDICVVHVPSASCSSPFDEKDLGNLRLYLGAVRNLAYNQGTSLNEVLENDLVEASRSGGNMTVETYHRWLTLARLQTISHGETELRIEHWRKTREMERLRMDRIPSKGC
ncbi:hypothetical protein R1sor_016731 [Riccia sorocarpa]|uniref:Mini-chromosome maintenance complex-binding protein n=1 Tax=Riccia sorocarpa TaxID=122646 RepID=A0ABD3HFX4_9MARC